MTWFYPSVSDQGLDRGPMTVHVGPRSVAVYLYSINVRLRLIIGDVFCNAQFVICREKGEFVWEVSGQGQPFLTGALAHPLNCNGEAKTHDQTQMLRARTRREAAVQITRAYDTIQARQLRKGPWETNVRV